jgi:hypothetical protein
MVGKKKDAALKSGSAQTKVKSDQSPEAWDFMYRQGLMGALFMRTS